MADAAARPPLSLLRERVVADVVVVVAVVAEEMEFAPGVGVVEKV